MMTWTLCLLALTPLPQSEALRIFNARPTLGLLGPAAASQAYLPGDTVTVTFDVTGLKLDSEGRCKFAMTIQVEDAQGKVCYVDSSESPTVGSLQNLSRVRHAAQVTLALDQPPGTYKMTLTVTDAQAKGKATYTHNFTVGQPGFGLVRTQMTADPNGRQPAACTGVVGQTLSISTVAVGFQFGGPTKEASLNVEMMLQGEGGKMITAKPVKAEFRNIPSGTSYLPLRFDVPLQEAGKYTLVIKATDQVTSKTAMLTMPIRIVDGE